MTPESIQALRDSLPPFAAAVDMPAELWDFHRYYGTDFRAQFPHARYRGGTVASGDYRLMLHRWLQPDARSSLVLVHGFFDHSGIYGRLIEYGLQRGCNVLIFDHPGHGLSSGDRCTIDDFGHYGRGLADVLAAAELPDVPRWVMAQSMGAAAVMEFGRQHRWPFEAAVLLAPLVRPAGWLRTRALHGLLRRFVDEVPRKFNENSSDQAFLQFLQAEPLQERAVPVRWVGALRRWCAGLPDTSLGLGPALVIQGDADTTVDWKYNMKAIVRLFPDSRIEYLAGAGHQLANESPALRQRYLALVDAYLQQVGKI